MRFNPKANIGGGRISGGGSSGGGGLGGGGLGGGGMRLPIPGGLGFKGTIIVVLLYLLVQCLAPNLPGPGLGGGEETQQQTTDDGTYDNCKTGEDANKDVDCARQAVALSLQRFWEKQFKEGTFKPASFRTFSGGVATGCGSANSGMGPFYCPSDLTIYEDPSFYEQVLQGQLGGEGGDFVEPYVLGHEYGHHIQNITGQMKNVRTQQGENSDAVKLELQADCYAGVWAKGATGVDDGSGEKIFAEIDEADIDEAIGAAKTVGDDSIQEKTQGRVNPDGWTHGSSEQRMQWFKTGYETGDLNACDKIWG